PLMSDYWDLQQTATVRCVSFAGFSAGNRDFAAYSDSRLGTYCDRVYQTLDVIPHTYAEKDMKHIRHIYEPDIETSALFDAAIGLVLTGFDTNGVEYRQIQRQQEPPRGQFNQDHRDFMQQMLWQHIEGYLTLLNLEHFVDVERILSASAAGMAQPRAALLSA